MRHAKFNRAVEIIRASRAVLGRRAVEALGKRRTGFPSTRAQRAAGARRPRSRAPRASPSVEREPVPRSAFPIKARERCLETPRRVRCRSREVLAAERQLRSGTVMPAPAVSIIMLAFNRERYLAESIESFLNQTFSDWELSVVDDGFSEFHARDHRA